MITDMMHDTLMEVPQSHADAKSLLLMSPPLHEWSFMDIDQTYIRDECRCIVTGKYELGNDCPGVEESSLRREATEYSRNPTIRPLN